MLTNKPLNKRNTWPTVKRVKNFDRKIGQSKTYKIINEILNAMLIASSIIGGILWTAL
jgi:hypothetical protein